jgi:hypothetical protein
VPNSCVRMRTGTVTAAVCPGTTGASLGPAPACARASCGPPATRESVAVAVIAAAS